MPGSFHTFRSRWVLRFVSAQQFITMANAIDAAKKMENLNRVMMRLEIPPTENGRYERDLGDKMLTLSTTTWLGEGIVQKEFDQLCLFSKRIRVVLAPEKHICEI